MSTRWPVAALRPLAWARVDRAARGRLVVCLARLAAAGLHLPLLVGGPGVGVVVPALGLAALLWLVASAVVGGVLALLRPRCGRLEVPVAVVDVAVFTAVAASTPGGYYPLVLLSMLRVFQLPARWGWRGALLGGLPLTAVALAFPSSEVTGIPDSSLLVVCVAIMAAGLGCGRFVRRQNALQDQTELALALTFDHSPTGTVLTDGDGVVTRVNPAAALLGGVPAEELLGRPLVTLIHHDDADALSAVLAGEAGDEVDVRLWTTRGPHWARLLVGRVPAASGLPSYLVVQAEDVHARRTATDRLAHEATHDALTGLPNRRAIREDLDALIAAPGPGGALVMIDLDGFKAVNDRLGHEAGDTLLVIVAERLRRAAHEGDLPGRLAGDEMVLIARGVPDEAGALAVGQRVLDELCGPADVGSGTVQLCASAGARWIGPGEHDVRQVLRDADAALYRAKESGRGRVEVASSTGGAVTRTPSALREASVAGP